MHSTRFNRLIIGTLALLATPTTTFAQDPPLAAMLPDMLGGVELDARFHRAHFTADPTEDGEDNPFLNPVQFNQQLVGMLTTLPIGSPSGGFTFDIDLETGTVARRSESFGPLFAERAMTLGKGRGSVGFSMVRATYDTFEGTEIGTGELDFFLRHQDTSGGPGSLDPAFEGDLVRSSLLLSLSTTTLAGFFNVGIADRVDIGAVVPITRVKLDATVQAEIVPLATATDNPRCPSGSCFHFFEDEETGEQTNARAIRENGQKTGIGDIELRTKIWFHRVEGGGLAASGSVRLPTGDEENLLGLGALQFRPSLIGSWTSGRVSPHFNFGYTFSAESDTAPIITDEINYALGMDIAVSPHVTIVGDLLGRTLRNAGRFVEATQTFEFTKPRGDIGQASFPELQREEGHLHLLTGAVGGKINLGGTSLLTVNVLFPLTDAGLRDNLTFTVGLEGGF